MIKHTNFDIKDAACLHIVHISQQPSSRPTTKSTQPSLVNAPTKNLSPLPAGKCGKSTKGSPGWWHQVDEGKNSFEAAMVQALAALPSVRSKPTLAAKKWWETHFWTNEEEETWIEDYVATETARATKRVESAEAAIKQEQEDTRTAENTRLMTREPEKKFHEMMVAIGDSPRDLASSDDWDDGEDEDGEETEHGKLSEDDAPNWVMGKISNTVQQQMGRFPHKHMHLHELRQPGWGDTANYFRERDEQYGTSIFMVFAVVKLQMNVDWAAPAPPTFGELMECLDIVPGISLMLQGTSRPGCGHIKLSAGQPQSNRGIAGLECAMEANSSHIHKAKPIQPVSFYPCI